MATDKTTAEPNPSPAHPLEPLQKTVDEVVYLLSDKNKPPIPFRLEDYPEWKRWALAGGLEEFAKLHNVQASFILYSMPKKLYKAYVNTLMQDKDLRNAVDAHNRSKAYLSDAVSHSIMAMIEGWDEEASESEEESLCLPEVVSHKT
jgi:hypothetical protein